MNPLNSHTTQSRDAHFKSTPLQSIPFSEYGLTPLRLLGDSELTTTILVQENESPGRLLVGRVLTPEKLFKSTDPEKCLKAYESELRILKTVKLPHFPRFIEEITIPSPSDSSISTRISLRESVPGESLSERIETKGKLSAEEVIQLLSTVAEDLAHIHNPLMNGLGERLVHGDIKPSNIILREIDERPILIDFNSSRLIEKGRTIFATFGPRGTLAYMPPEAFQGDCEPYSDIFSLGVTALYCLYGENFLKVVTDEKTAHLVSHYTIPKNSNLPQGLKKVLEKMIAPRIQDRFQSADELIRVLSKLSNISLSSRSALPPFRRVNDVLAKLYAPFDLQARRFRKLVQALKDCPFDGSEELDVPYLELRDFSAQHSLPIETELLLEVYQRYTDEVLRKLLYLRVQEVSGWRSQKDVVHSLSELFHTFPRELYKTLRKNGVISEEFVEEVNRYRVASVRDVSQILKQEFTSALNGNKEPVGVLKRYQGVFRPLERLAELELSPDNSSRSENRKDTMQKHLKEAAKPLVKIFRKQLDELLKNLADDSESVVELAFRKENRREKLAFLEKYDEEFNTWKALHYAFHRRKL